MRAVLLIVGGVLVATGPVALAQRVEPAAQPSYFPGRFEWQRKSPQDAGMDAAAIAEAVKFAIAAENPSTKDLFESPHNRTITWDHLLRQTSDWQGTLWGKPDWGDRPEGEKPSDWLKPQSRSSGL